MFCGQYLCICVSLSLCLNSSLFKTSLLGLLYYKDCITPRQSWLFFIQSQKQKQKQDKMKLENI